MSKRASGSSLSNLKAAFSSISSSPGFSSIKSFAFLANTPSGAINHANSLSPMTYEFSKFPLEIQDLDNGFVIVSNLTHHPSLGSERALPGFLFVVNDYIARVQTADVLRNPTLSGSSSHFPGQSVTHSKYNILVKQ